MSGDLSDIHGAIEIPAVPDLAPGSTVAVFGMGRTGIAASRLLSAMQHRVLLLESRNDAEQERQAQELEKEAITVVLGAPLALASLPRPLPAAALVSPGIAWDHPELQRMRSEGIAVIGEMSLASRATAAIPWVGITGTNGKTTVTHLVHHLLQHGGLRAPLCGNVGIPAAAEALQSLQSDQPRPDWLVVELSSYQIEQSPELAPAIGVWTTLTPDHLERHGSLDHYRAIKRRLLENAAVRVLNADDADLRSRAGSWQDATWVTAGRPEDLPAPMQPRLWIAEGQVQAASGPLFGADALAMPGAHNRQNMLMATAVALEAGLTADTIAQGLRSFPGVPHRLERIRLRQSVLWTNDSKATNYDAAAVALRALEGPLVVLAGGQAKQGDASGWIEQLKRQAAAVVLFGEARERFATLLDQGGFSGQVHRCEGMAEAVPLAAALAAALGCCGVLLSPACASFDQYRDFEQRGDHFRQLVEALAD